jgi:hypothetical protein
MRNKVTYSETIKKGRLDPVHAMKRDRWSRGIALALDAEGSPISRPGRFAPGKKLIFH